MLLLEKKLKPNFIKTYCKTYQSERLLNFSRELKLK